MRNIDDKINYSTDVIRGYIHDSDYNSLKNEIANLITMSGLELDDNDDTQLFQTLNKLINNRVLDTTYNTSTGTYVMASSPQTPINTDQPFVIIFKNNVVNTSDGPLMLIGNKYFNLVDTENEKLKADAFVTGYYIGISENDNLIVIKLDSMGGGETTTVTSDSELKTETITISGEEFETSYTMKGDPVQNLVIVTDSNDESYWVSISKVDDKTCKIDNYDSSMDGDVLTITYLY